MDKAEFTRRTQAAEQKLYRVACAYLAQPCDREDALQETLLRAWQKRHTLKSPEYFETWITRILVHVCVDLIRRSRRVIPTETLPESAGEGPRDPVLRSAIDQLETPLRAAVVLHYVQGYDTAAVARILGVPQGTVKSRLSRARRKLQLILKEDGEQ